MTDTPAPWNHDPSAPRPEGNRTAAAVAAGAAVLVVVLAVVGLTLLGGDEDERDTVATEQSDSVGEQAEVPAEEPEEEPAPPAAEQPVGDTVTAGPCTYRLSDRPAARAVEPPSEQDVATSGSYTTTLETSAGRIVFVSDASRVPCTLGSLRNLAEQKYFDGTRCHRLTTEGIFVLQCGDPTASGSGGPGYEYDDEALDGATYPAGTVAMANAGPGTNGSQFFLVYEDTQLPPSYTPLGRITEGLDVVREIGEAGVEGGASDGPPATPVEIATLRVGQR